MKVRAWRSKREQGFTLVEFMVILAIIAILGALAVPAMVDWLPNQRLRKAARELHSALQLARIEAIKNNMSHRVVFNAGAGTYQLENAGPDNLFGTGDDIVRPPKDLASYGSGIGFGWGNATNAAPDGGPMPGVPITFGGNEVVFTTRGLLNPPAEGYVYLQNIQGAAYAVGAMTSGAIRIVRWFDASANWE